MFDFTQWYSILCFSRRKKKSWSDNSLKSDNWTREKILTNQSVLYKLIFNYCIIWIQIKLKCEIYLLKLSLTLFFFGSVFLKLKHTPNSNAIWTIDIMRSMCSGMCCCLKDKRIKKKSWIKRESEKKNPNCVYQSEKCFYCSCLHSQWSTYRK